MKKQWIVPKIAEISIKMTEVQVKKAGTGDMDKPGMSEWFDCPCCS